MISDVTQPPFCFCRSDEEQPVWTLQILYDKEMSVYARLYIYSSDEEDLPVQSSSKEDGLIPQNFSYTLLEIKVVTRTQL